MNLIIKNIQTLFIQGCYVNIDEFKSELLATEHLLLKKNSKQTHFDLTQLELSKIIFGNQDSY